MAKDITKLVAKIEQKQEVKEEVTNFDEQLKTLRLAVTNLITCTDNVRLASLEVPVLLASFNAAKDSIDNAVDGICNAITRAHQTPVKVDFTDESKSYLEAAHQKLIENENVLIKNHESKVDNSLKALGNKVEKAMNGYKGIFVDKKNFNIYYWLFIVILEIALCSTALLIYYVIKFGWL